MISQIEKALNDVDSVKGSERGRLGIIKRIEKLGKEREEWEHYAEGLTKYSDNLNEQNKSLKERLKTQGESIGSLFKTRDELERAADIMSEMLFEARTCADRYWKILKENGLA
jgi:uncharacterized coiled-coil DUF342 family protein